MSLPGDVPLTTASLEMHVLDMLRLDLLLDRTMLTGLCPLTWIVLPATGIDFQPQTRYADTKVSIVHSNYKLQCIFLYKMSEQIQWLGVFRVFYACI